MNIKIDKIEFDYLYTHKLYEYVVGSKMYGVDTKLSDTDILVIIKYPFNENFLGYPNHHQFQYDDVDNNTQYIFNTEEQFWRNQMSGDSTINSDVILFNDTLDEEYRIDRCRTYKIIKAYLGFAKRDIKQYQLKPNKYGTSKLKHALRSMYCAEKLINNELPLISDIKKIYRKRKFNVGEINDQCALIRRKCNEMFNKKLLQLYFIPDATESLYQKLLESNNQLEFYYD